MNQPIVLSGTIEHGKGQGHLSGFPTANLKTGEGSLPEYGVYASVLAAEDGILRAGVTNVGTRPTADDNPRPTVETWLPGYSGDLYGHSATLLLVDYLRGIRAFDDMSALKRQIDADAAKAAEITASLIRRSVLSRGAEQTRAIGARIGEKLRQGDVLTLHGPLGAGKSELARGIARGLDIEGPLPSPTFTILNMYTQGRLPLYHYDWYRIEDPEELLAIGAEEHLPGDGVTLVEWSEQAPELLPETRLEVRYTVLETQTRLLTLNPKGGFRPVTDWLPAAKEIC